MTLEELRKRLSEVDRDLIGLVAARQKIVAEIGAHKIQNSVPTRDYEREREVLKAAHDRAEELGLEPELATDIMGKLIRASLTYQERTRVAAQTSGAGKRRVNGLLNIVVTRQQQNAGGQFVLHNEVCDLLPVHARQINVQYGDLRFKGLYHFQALFAAGGLADHHHIRFKRQGICYSLSKQRVIIHNQE